MALDLNATALFAQVVQNKSFSAASRRLRIPVSTLSRKISALEKELGTRLLERSTRKLRLTELGREYYEYCLRGLEELETGAHMISDRQAEVSGTLRVSAPPSLADSLLVPLVCAFQEAYPRTTVRILATERNVDLVEDGVDIALRVGEPKISSCIARPLLKYRHVLVASPDYVESQGSPKRPEMLSAHRLITFGGWHEPIVWRLTRRRQTVPVRVESVLTLNDYAGIQFAAEAGKGIAEMPSILCGRALQDGRLVEVLPAWRFSPTILSAVYPSRRNLSRIVRLFKDFCVENIEQLAPYSRL